MGFLRMRNPDSIIWLGAVNCVEVNCVNLDRELKYEIEIETQFNTFKVLTKRDIDVDALLNAFAAGISVSRIRPDHNTIYELEKWLEEAEKIKKEKTGRVEA